MATKKDLADNLARRLRYLHSKDAELAVDSVIDCLTEGLKTGNRIELRGFGSLSVKSRKYAKQERSYRVVYFRMAKIIRQALKKTVTEKSVTE